MKRNNHRWEEIEQYKFKCSICKCVKHKISDGHYVNNGHGDTTYRIYHFILYKPHGALVFQNDRPDCNNKKE